MLTPVEVRFVPVLDAARSIREPAENQYATNRSSGNFLWIIAFIDNLISLQFYTRARQEFNQVFDVNAVDSKGIYRFPAIEDTRTRGRKGTITVYNELDTQTTYELRLIRQIADFLTFELLCVDQLLCKRIIMGKTTRRNKRNDIFISLLLLTRLQIRSIFNIESRVYKRIQTFDIFNTSVSRLVERAKILKLKTICNGEKYGERAFLVFESQPSSFRVSFFDILRPDIVHFVFQRVTLNLKRI